MEKTKIEFGTDGFRGIIAKDFTFCNVERIIKAICLYLKSLNSEKNTIITGYDPRFMAYDFALFCAENLKKFGFRVILSSKVVPTPIVAYCAKYYPDSTGAIMLTASHNPKEYQGIKFIPDYAGPASKEITDKILSYLDKKMPEEKEGTIEVSNLEEEYFSHIEKIIDFNIIKKNQPKIIYDGLFSSSIGYFDELLKRNNIEFKSYNTLHSSDFGGGLPEPKEKWMKYKEKGYITVANDGDADRYGIIDEKGNYISPNIVLAMLLKYLSKKGKTGKMIKTTGVSRAVDITAQKLNIETITTPVGFKWLSEKMRQNKTILAGEDSGGLSAGEHIPEKDGIYANLLIIEMMASENKPLYQLVQEIKDFIGCEFYCDRVDIKVKNDEEADIIEEKFGALEELEGLKVKDRLLIDGEKIFFDDDKTSLLIRKSGTEPLLRIYIETCDFNKLNDLKKTISNISTKIREQSLK